MFVITFEDTQMVIRKEPDLSPNDLGASANSATPIHLVKN